MKQWMYIFVAVYFITVSSSSAQSGKFVISLIIFVFKAICTSLSYYLNNVVFKAIYMSLSYFLNNVEFKAISISVIYLLINAVFKAIDMSLSYIGCMIGLVTMIIHSIVILPSFCSVFQ